jgi:glucosamine--fructose-6-phosphate aminotransferase (isomerizing)
MIMKTKGQYTIQEITSQPEIWPDVIESFHAHQSQVVAAYQALQPEALMFIGCGSTHYLSQVAAALFQSLTHIPAKAVPSSEALLFPEQTIPHPQRTLLVAISRSGTTTETIQAVSRFRSMGGLATWVIGCYPESELAQIGDLALLAEAAREQSVAQTRSFSSMLILAQALAATIGGRDTAPLSLLPDRLNALFDKFAALMEALGQRLDLERAFFLGSNYQYGIANEAMLKMKEMSLTNSEAYHFLEFRHGPMSMATDEALVIGLLSDAARTHEERVLSEMSALGAHTVGLRGVPGLGHEHAISFEDRDLPAWAVPVLFLPPLQLLAFHRSISKGLDPDNPRNLEAVVSLDSAAFVTG